MNRPTVRIVALLAALTFAVSACGGGSEETSSSGGDTQQSGSSQSGSSQSGDPGSSGTAGIEFGGEFDGSVEACGQIASAFAAIAIGPSMALLSGEEGLAEARSQLSGETFSVPAELEEPFGVLDEAYAELERSLEGVNIADAMSDPEAMSRIDEATAAYDTAEVDAALEQVGAFLEANCTDFDLGDIGG